MPTYHEKEMHFLLKPMVAAIALSGFTYALPAMAETSDEHVTTMSVVTVTGTAPKNVTDTAQTVWSVSGDAVLEANRSGQSLSKLLSENVPSLDVSSEGRTNYGQNMRGRAMLVMIDGVSLNSARGISRQLDAIDPFNIEKIEVLSGATAIYGAGATGGVINIITKKGNASQSDAGLGFESFASTTSGLSGHEDLDYKLSQSVSMANDVMEGRLSATYGKSGAFYDGGGDLVVPDNTQGSVQFNELQDYMGTLTLTPSDTETINVLGQYYSSTQDSPYGIYYGPNLDGSTVEVRDGFDSDRQAGTKRWMFNTSYHNSDVLGHEMVLQASYRKEELAYIPFPRFAGAPFPSTSYVAASEQNTDVMSLRAALIKSFNRVTLTYGVDGYIDKYNSNQAIFNQSISNETGGLVNKTVAEVGRYPDTKTSALAGFAQVNVAITDQWSIEGGYRYQHMTNKVDDFVDADIQAEIVNGHGASADTIKGGKTGYNVGLFNIGTTYRFSPHSKAWANFSQGFELPSAAKHYGQGHYTLNGSHWELDSSTNINDDALEGIKTDSFEVGLRQDYDAFSWQASAYYSLSDKSIKTNSTTLLIEVQDNKKRVYGIEALASYWFTDTVQAGVSGHWVNSDLKTEGSWEKVAAKEASSSKAGSWVGWYQDNYDVKLASQTLFDLNDDADGKINGYTLFDLTGSYKLPVGRLGFGVHNLLNKEYTTVWGQRAQMLYAPYYGPASAYDYKGRGRAFTLSYSWNGID